MSQTPGVQTQKRRIVLLVDGFLDVFTAKTAVGLLRYRPDEVVAVIDSAHAGEDLVPIVGTGAGVPIVARLAEVTNLAPNQLILGAVFPGGKLPDNWRRTILEALDAGMDIVNGLHQRLADDKEFAEAAARKGCRIEDVRTPPHVSCVGKARARQTRGKRILTIGTDCNLGKRVTALELTRALEQAGRKAAFIPTGQTGVMTVGRGISIDAVPSDFVAGVVEQAILEFADADFILVEGQGALLHPGFSAVTLGLMHGALPDYLVLCHAPARKTMRNSDIPVASCSKMIELSEAILEPLHPAKTIGISLNCHGMTDEEARAAREATAAETGLTVVDSIKTGVGPLVEWLMANG